MAWAMSEMLSRAAVSNSLQHVSLGPKKRHPGWSFGNTQPTPKNVHFFGSAVIGTSTPRVNRAVRGDVVDLAARRTDIHKLPVA